MPFGMASGERSGAVTPEHEAKNCGEQFETRSRGRCSEERRKRNSKRLREADERWFLRGRGKELSGKNEGKETCD